MPIFRRMRQKRCVARMEKLTDAEDRRIKLKTVLKNMIRGCELMCLTTGSTVSYKHGKEQPDFIRVFYELRANITQNRMLEIGNNVARHTRQNCLLFPHNFCNSDCLAMSDRHNIFRYSPSTAARKKPCHTFLQQTLLHRGCIYANTQTINHKHVQQNQPLNYAHPLYFFVKVR
jgi:hypothetical protein